MKRYSTTSSSDFIQQSNLSKPSPHFTTSTRHDYYRAIDNLLNDSSDDSDNDSSISMKKSDNTGKVDSISRDFTYASLKKSEDIPSQGLSADSSSVSLENETSSKYNVSKRRVFIESDSDEENDLIDQSNDEGRQVDIYKDEKSLKQNDFSNVSIQLFQSNEKKNRNDEQERELEDEGQFGQFELEDCSSFSSSSSYSTQPQPQHDDYHVESQKQCGQIPDCSTGQKQTKANEEDDTTFSSYPVQSIRMGLRGVSESPSFNKRSRNWFQKVNSPPKKSPKSTKEDGKKALRQSTISFPIYHGNANKDRKQKNDEEQAKKISHEIPIEIVEIHSDDDNIERDQLKQTEQETSFYLRSSSKRTDHKMKDAAIYDIDNSADEIQSFNSVNEEESHHESMDGNYQYESDDIEDDNTYKFQKISNLKHKDDDEVCIVSTSKVPEPHPASRKERAKKTRKVSYLKTPKSKAEFVQVGGKYSDIWMKSSATSSLNKVTRRHPIRNDLSGGSGVGVGGFTFLGNNDGENETFVSEENPTTRKNRTSKTKISKSKERKSNTTKKSQSYTRRYKKGTRKRWGGKYKKRSNAPNKSKSKNTQNAWSNRAQGHGSRSKGGEYMQISRQDPQLGNDGGANITF